MQDKDRQVRPSSRIALDYKPRLTTRYTPSRIHWFSLGLVLSIGCGVGAYLLNQRPRPWMTETSIVVPTLTTKDLPSIDPGNLIATPRLPPPEAILEIIVQPNDTLDRLFRRFKLNTGDLAEIRTLQGVDDKLDHLRPGERIVMIQDQGAIQSMEWPISETERLAVKRNKSSFETRLISTPIDTRLKHAHGKIVSSLFDTALAAGVSAETVMHLVNDVFGWKIDFALEIQPGDSFNLIYEQRFRDGQYLNDGQILAAEFLNAGVTYRAVYYASNDTKISGHFDPEGRSVRRQFLRAPLDFNRISSNFNLRRRHPILDLIRAHRGVDYAAPTGTVIKAAGDGRVSFASTKGGYGNVVVLEHGAGISTLYGHMSRFATALRVGTRVQQGQPIGYVGSSGTATGPHLHYEYRVNGIHQNPRTVALPDAKPIPANYLSEFAAKRDSLLAELDRLEESSLVATSTSRP